MSESIHTLLANDIRSLLTDDDDVVFWQAAIKEVITDVEFLCRKGRKSHTVFAEIGRCSHWMAPHKATWTADGGFAWPSGYRKKGGFFNGLPEYDWSLVWQFEPLAQSWDAVDKPGGKRWLLFRAAFPARTQRHLQAAVHTVWTPGSPPDPIQELVQFYGFRKSNDRWQCTATRTYPGSEVVYE